MDRYSAVYATYANPSSSAGPQQQQQQAPAVTAAAPRIDHQADVHHHQHHQQAQYQQRRGPAPFASVEDISSVASFESASSPVTQQQQQGVYGQADPTNGM